MRITNTHAHKSMPFTFRDLNNEKKVMCMNITYQVIAIYNSMNAFLN